MRAYFFMLIMQWLSVKKRNIYNFHYMIFIIRRSVGNHAGFLHLQWRRSFTILVSECTLVYSRLQYCSVSVQSRTVGYSADQWPYSGEQKVTVLVSEWTLAYSRLEYWSVPYSGVLWITVLVMVNDSTAAHSRLQC